MAATVVFSKQDQQSRARPIKKYIYDWTSHTDGAVALATPVTGNEFASGEILSITTVPSAVDVPTDNYDLTIIDEQGVDVMMGLGTNRSATVSQKVVPLVYLSDGGASPDQNFANRSLFIDDKLRIVVANAGSGKKGKVVITVR